MEENQDKSPKEDIDISASEEIEQVDPDRLKAHPLNRHIYGKEDIGGLYESIKEDGQEEPLVVNEKYKIISGHLRYQAFQELRKKRPDDKRFNLVSVKVKRFASEEDEIECLLISNETRDTTDLQKVLELEQWNKLMEQDKYSHLSKGQKRQLIIKRVKLSSERSHSRIKRVLKFINELKADESKALELEKTLKKFQGFSLGAMDKEIKDSENTELKELTPPTMKELLTAGEEKLKKISARYKLRLRPEMFRNQKNYLKAFAEKIAEKLKEKLDIDLGEPDDEELKNHWKNVGYETLKDMNKHELKSVVDTLGLSIDPDDFMGFESSIFFAQAIAEKLGIDAPRFSVEEIRAMSLEDMESRAKKEELDSEVDENEEDPVKKRRKEMAESLGIKKEFLKSLKDPFDLNRYRKKFVPLEYGRLKVGVTASSNKGEPLTVELKAGKDKKRVEKIVELLENIDSGNIESLIAEARKSRSGIDFDTP